MLVKIILKSDTYAKLYTSIHRSLKNVSKIIIAIYVCNVIVLIATAVSIVIVSLFIFSKFFICLYLVLCLHSRGC